MRNHILIVDDDLLFQQEMADRLAAVGYKVDLTGWPAEGMRKAYNSSPDLIMLAKRVFGDQLWQTCRNLRLISNVPIIVLGVSATESYIAKAFEAGADLYLAKPIGLDELEARIKALLRRAYGPHTIPRVKTNVIRRHDLVIDLDRRQVTYQGQLVELRRTAFNLLACLAKHAGKTLNHGFLLREVWGHDQIDQLDVLRHNVSYLRKMLALKPGHTNYIRSVWGVGYRLE